MTEQKEEKPRRWLSTVIDDEWERADALFRQRSDAYQKSRMEEGRKAKAQAEGAGGASADKPAGDGGAPLGLDLGKLTNGIKEALLPDVRKAAAEGAREELQKWERDEGEE